MSLFDVKDLIEIKLYYKYIEVKGVKKVDIVPDEKAEEVLSKLAEKEDGSDDKEKIHTVTTKWKNLSWKENNNISSRAVKETGPMGERRIDLVVYRDLIVKSCLKEWDLMDNGQIVPVTPEAIDSLPGNIVLALYYKFDYIMGYSEEDLKN